MTSTNNLLTVFPNGVSSFGVPVLGSGGTVPTTTGNVWFVSSTTGSNGNDGQSGATAFATLQTAINAAVANNGDLILIEPNHVETIVAAGGITCNKAGLIIWGLGEGTSWPTFTFSTSTAASFLVTAPAVQVSNILGLSGINGLTNPFNVQANTCTMNVVWRDTATNVEAVRAVLTSAAATRFNLTLKHIGQVGGSACVNAVRLVGNGDTRIQIDAYGKYSTAVVEFATTAATNVVVTGYMYNSGTTDGSKDVVDTITGSTWYALVEDGASGFTYEGGSGSPFVKSDAASVNANMAVPTANSTSNVLSRDVDGNKTDNPVYAPTATASEIAYLKGAADLQESVAVSATAVLTNGQTLFTVAGGPIQIVSLMSIFQTANGATASTFQYSSSGTLGATTQTISGASASLANATAGMSVILQGATLATAPLVNAGAANLANGGTINVPAGTITAVVGVGSTTGTVTHYIRYVPLAKGVTVS